MLFEKHKTQKYRKKKVNYKRNEFANKTGRTIPPFIQMKIIFHGVLAIIGTVFFILGMIGTIAFGSLISFSDFSFNEDDLKAEGKIIDVRGTDSYENDERVYEYLYTYECSNGNTYTGTSHKAGTQLSAGATIEVQYKEDNPETSRAIGMNKGVFSPWVLFFVLIFPSIGSVMLLFVFKKGFKNLRILKFGVVSTGVFQYREATNSKINNAVVYRYFFKFKDNKGTEYTAYGDTHRPNILTDEAKEPLVYNPENPNEAVMVDALPRIVRQLLSTEINQLKS